MVSIYLHLDGERPPVRSSGRVSGQGTTHFGLLLMGAGAHKPVFTHACRRTACPTIPPLELGASARS